MSESAFGVDHGEVSKLLNPVAAIRGARAAKKTASLNAAADRVGAQMRAAYPKPKLGAKPTAGSGAAKPFEPATKENRLRSQGIGRLGVRNYQGGVYSGQARRRSGF